MSLRSEAPLPDVVHRQPTGRRHHAGALLCACALVASCATGRSAETQIEELRLQLRQQAELIALQQGRLEQLELRLSGVAQAQESAGKPAAQPTAGAVQATRPAPPPAAPPTATPASPKALQTVKLQPHGGRSRLLDRRASPTLLRQNPVDRAPHLPAHVELKEPDESVLAELESAPPPLDPRARDLAGADRSFAEAVALLNDGQYLSAQTAFLAFAARNPRHHAADNALYFAGLARAASGDCEGALHHYGRVTREYPAGDAVLASRLESGRCLIVTGRKDQGRAMLERLAKEHPATSEASQAQRLLAEDRN